MDAIEQRLRNLRRLDMTDDLDLPDAPELMQRARVRRQRRRIAATIGGLGVAAAAIGAVVGIALRDDPDKVSAVDDPPRTTVTVAPTTTSTTAETTTSTTASTTTTTLPPDTPPALKPPDAEFPTAGTCGGTEGDVVTAEVFDDVPAPRCLQVLPHQRLELTNRLSVPLNFDLGRQRGIIQPGKTYVLSRTFGEFLLPGVHHMNLRHDLPDANSTGPEIWLVAELDPQT